MACQARVECSFDVNSIICCIFTLLNIYSGLLSRERGDFILSSLHVVNQCRLCRFKGVLQMIKVASLSSSSVCGLCFGLNSNGQDALLQEEG